MERRRREDQAITLLCFCVSGIALVVGMWIAASPLSVRAHAGTTGTIALAEAR